MAGDEPTGAARGAEIDRLRRAVDRLTAERAGLQAQLADRPPSIRERRRRPITGFLAGLCCVFIFLSAITVWAHRTVISTDGFVSTVVPVIDRPSVTEAMGADLTRQIFAAIDVQDDVKRVLPPKGQFLAVPLANAAQTFVQQQVVKVLRTPQFRAVWVTVLRTTHQQIIAALRGETSTLTVSNGMVVLNVLPLVNVALQQIQSTATGLLGRDITIPSLTSGEVPAQIRASLSSSLGVQLPADFGQVELAKADSLQVARNSVELLDLMVWLLPLLTVVLLAVTIWLSTTRRRTLLQILIGTAVALVVERRVAAWIQSRVIDSINPANRDAGRDIVHQLLSGLTSLTAWLLALAVLAIVVELVTGPYQWAGSLRARTRSVSRDLSDAFGRRADDQPAVLWLEAHHRKLQAGGAALGGVLLLLVPGWWFFVVVVLLAAYEAALWRVGSGHPPTATGAGPSPPTGA